MKVKHFSSCSKLTYIFYAVNFINLKVINNIDGFLLQVSLQYPIPFIKSDCHSSERYSIDCSEEGGIVVICRIIIPLHNGLQKGG